MPKPPVDATPKSLSKWAWIPTGAFNHLLRYRVDILERVLGAIDDTVRSGKRDHEQEWRKYLSSNPPQNEERDYGDYLGDEAAALDEVLRDGQLFHIVGLYHAVEHFIGKVFAWRLSGLPEPDAEKLCRRVHRWDELKGLASTYFSLDLEQLDGYDAVNRLRLITNAVKHQGGTVSQELHDATGWTLKEPIDPTSISLAAARKDALCFVRAFGEHAERDCRVRFGPPGR